jgi:hypothetical protein
MPADEHILILQRHGLGECLRSRMIEEAPEFEDELVLSDHSLLLMQLSLGRID